MRKENIRIISYFLFFLLQCGRIYGVEGEANVKQVGDSIWLVDSKSDTLIAHAVLTLKDYNADPTGKRDATSALSKAIRKVGNLGGGLIYIPPGKYRVDGNLLMAHNNVVIQGAGPDKTVLLAFNGKGREEGPPFVLMKGSSCALKDLGIYYPEQGTRTFSAYPYTISSGGSSLLENITLYNSYKGILFGPINGVLVENVKMCALKQGIAAKWSSEFGWSRNIEVSAGIWQQIPEWLGKTKPNLFTIRNYMKRNCIAMELGALDGFLVDGLEAKDCKTALLIKKDKKFIKNYKNGAETRRDKDNFGFGGILSGIKGSIQYNGHDFYYWGIPAINLDRVSGLPELRKKWPKLRQAEKTSSRDFFNVRKFGAKGDGRSDDTIALEKSLEKAAANGGGIVYLPQGQYRITKPLTIPRGTELRGACGRQELRLAGKEVTSLLVEFGAHSENPEEATAAISLKQKAGIRGLNILFPKQWNNLSEKGYNPVPYPYAVRGMGSGVYLIDCTITPSWLMVDFASHRCDHFMIKRVAGWGIKKGFNIGGGSIGGSIEFTQVTYGLTLGTVRNPLLAGKVQDGWEKSFKILSEYSGKNTTPYLFGDAANITCYGLQAFHPLKHIEIYKQNGKSLRDSQFYYPILDVSLKQSLVMEGARNLDFFGYWVTGRKREYNWVKGNDIKNIRVFAPGIQPSYHRGNYQDSVPLEEFELIPETAMPDKTTVIAGNPDVRHILDGNLKTFWKSPIEKAHFILDFGKPTIVHRYSLADGHLMNFKDDTAIKEYRISASLDNKKWQPLVIPETTFMKFKFKNPQKYVLLDQAVAPIKARYIKFEVLDSWSARGKKGDAIIRLFNVWTR